MKTLLHGELLVPLLLWLLAAGCSDGEKHPYDPPPRSQSAPSYNDTLFHPPLFDEGRRLDTVVKADFDGDGREEYVVASIAPDSVIPPGGRADLIQIFSYDPAARRYAQALADTVNWASSFELRDVTGDRLPELIVHTCSGGNDVVASNGLAIYSGAGRSIRTIFGRPDGDPTLSALDHAKGEGVLVHEELWPAFASHADAVEYLSDVLAFRDGAYISIRKEQSRRFADLAAGYLREYRGARDKFAGDTVVVTGTSAPAAPPPTDEVHPLFNPAALAMLSFGIGDDLRSLRSFWTSEREYLLRRLPSEQLAELDAIYARMIAL